MAKLYFYYSAMNAGKTTNLLQSRHNYVERGMNTLVIKPRIDSRSGENRVRSRIGLEAEAVDVDASINLLDLVQNASETQPIDCVLVDEAQFLSADQVDQLTEVVDALNIPVLAYGLRTDFLGALFEGSRQLLALSDELREIKTICHCGRKATMVVRFDGEGQPMHSGDQIQIGGNETYVSMCRRHFKESLKIAAP
ncbi:MAG TPA: thymidine kinase [Gammaproteobacteria bacterium]|nr:MAG: thymidine kinase [Proteobacteria bacterium TMED51]RPG01895.1 MAG: thymidine kinase [Proteobacteria bacterium TMED51]HAU42924.1 thymidine kinase [Gammaproteobacteria bacterium]HCL94242.1 thymidine kinase [Gammaproteobacteria bacterium]